MTPKERYFSRVYREAQIIKCACGCGCKFKNRDRYARPRKYVNGHNGRKYVDPTQYKREWNHRNRPARMSYKAIFHRHRKVKLVKLAGSQCVSCGLQYNGKNACVFHFHHLPEFKKLFSIGNQLTNKSWASILKEFKKCELNCANCHEMKHSAQF